MANYMASEPSSGGTCSNEYNVVRKKYSTIVKAVVESRAELVSNLFERNFITRENVTAINAITGRSPYERSSDVILMVLGKIEYDEGNLYTFLEILRNIGQGDLAAKLSSALAFEDGTIPGLNNPSLRQMHTLNISVNDPAPTSNPSMNPPVNDSNPNISVNDPVRSAMPSTNTVMLFTSDAGMSQLENKTNRLSISGNEDVRSKPPLEGGTLSLNAVHVPTPPIPPTPPVPPSLPSRSLSRGRSTNQQQPPKLDPLSPGHDISDYESGFQDGDMDLSYAGDVQEQDGNAVTGASACGVGDMYQSAFMTNGTASSDYLRLRIVSGKSSFLFAGKECDQQDNLSVKSAGEQNGDDFSPVAVQDVESSLTQMVAASPMRLRHSRSMMMLSSDSEDDMAAVENVCRRLKSKGKEVKTLKNKLRSKSISEKDLKAELLVQKRENERLETVVREKEIEMHQLTHKYEVNIEELERKLEEKNSEVSRYQSKLAKIEKDSQTKKREYESRINELEKESKNAKILYDLEIKNLESNLKDAKAEQKLKEGELKQLKMEKKEQTLQHKEEMVMHREQIVGLKEELCELRASMAEKQALLEKEKRLNAELDGELKASKAEKEAKEMRRNSEMELQQLKLEHTEKIKQMEESHRAAYRSYSTPMDRCQAAQANIATLKEMIRIQEDIIEEKDSKQTEGTDSNRG